MQLRLIHKLLALFLLAAMLPLLALQIGLQYYLRELPPESVNGAQLLLQRQQTLYAAIVILTVLAAVLAAILMSRSIVQPIHRLRAHARRMLAGEFPTFALPGAEKELVDLAAVLSEMSTGLQALAREAELHNQDVEKLYQEASRRATALETIHGVSQRISSLLEIDDLLPEIVELVRAAFDYEQIHLFTLDHAAGELVFRAGAGRAGRVGAEIGERLSIHADSLPARVARAGQPVKDRAAPPAARSEIGVPLAQGNKIIGVLHVQSDLPEAFDDRDVSVLQELANQAAGAIVNAQLYEEAFNHAEEIMALLMTSIAVSTAPDLDVRLEAIAHHARRLMNAEGCTVFRLDTQNNVLYPLISLDPLQAQMMSLRIPVGQAITGRVVATGQGEIVNNVQNDPRAVLAPGTPDEPECLLAVPLLVADRAIGAMTVHRRGAHAFTPHDLELLTMFAGQAAVAIENAELYQQLKERAETLQRAYKELDEADKIKDEMIQNISHELRTPLTFVIGYISLVLEGDFGPLTQAQRDSLALVLKKAQGLNRMVDDIITLQTIRIAQPELEPMDLAALMRRAAEILRPRAQQANINIVTELPPTPLWVKGEQTRLAQVFDNLLDNAVKFSPKGGAISMRAFDAGAHVQVEIRDAGIGIPSDKLDKVFERFYQVDGTATRQFGGLGMGLTICKSIIAAHGGRIWIESPILGDHGACVYFTLQKAAHA